MERLERPSREQVKSTVQHIVAKKLSVSLDEVTADSLDAVEIQMALEEEFAIEITGDKGGHMRTVGDLVDLVHQKVGEQSKDQAQLPSVGYALDRGDRMAPYAHRDFAQHLPCARNCGRRTSQAESAAPCPHAVHNIQ